MKLISMTDFVLEQELPTYMQNEEFEEAYYKLYNYANFLKQPLELWMFVPCDENGNVLEQCDDICSCECDKIKAFRKAKERCLFDGFEIRDKGNFYFIEQKRPQLQFRRGRTQNHISVMPELNKKAKCLN